MVVWCHQKEYIWYTLSWNNSWHDLFSKLTKSVSLKFPQFFWDGWDVFLYIQAITAVDDTFNDFTSFSHIVMKLWRLFTGWFQIQSWFIYNNAFVPFVIKTQASKFAIFWWPIDFFSHGNTSIKILLLSGEKHRGYCLRKTMQWLAPQFLFRHTGNLVVFIVLRYKAHMCIKNAFHG